MRVFMVQGCFIGLLGTGLGLIVGIPLAYGIEDIVQFLEQVFDFQLLKSDSYPISFVPTDPLFADIVYVTLTALLLSLLATLYPAWRASKVKPAEALRFEV
jgi:lipoprotein-releasing system permease protein